MASFVKYQSFAVNLAKGAFDLQTAGAQLKCALSNTAPTVATEENLAGITTIAYTNITETMPIDILNTGSENPGGTWEVVATDQTLNATGAVATFQYVILYDELSTTDLLMGYWDYGSGVTLASGESFTINFGANLLTVA